MMRLARLRGHALGIRQDREQDWRPKAPGTKSGTAQSVAIAIKGTTQFRMQLSFNQCSCPSRSLAEGSKGVGDPGFQLGVSQVWRIANADNRAQKMEGTT